MSALWKVDMFIEATPNKVVFTFVCTGDEGRVSYLAGAVLDAMADAASTGVRFDYQFSIIPYVGQMHGVGDLLKAAREAAP